MIAQLKFLMQVLLLSVCFCVQVAFGMGSGGVRWRKLILDFREIYILHMHLQGDQDARRKLFMQWELATMQSNFHGMVLGRSPHPISLTP